MEEKKEETKVENKIEAKVETSTDKKSSSKPAKKKKEKIKIIPFDKIDITTATEDEIIKSGLKHNTKADVTCYFLLFIIAVLAVLPPLVRFFHPRPITKEEREIVYNTLKCYKTIIRDNYELSTVLTSNYRDGEVQTVEFNFKYFKRNDKAEEGYVFAEIDELDKLNVSGITKKKEVGNAIFTVDFENNQGLKDNNVLKDYTYFVNAEVNLLSNEKGYSCSNDSESKLEVVDVKTGKKIE